MAVGLREFLALHKEEFNKKFYSAKTDYPNLSEDDFLEVLKQSYLPLLEILPVIEGEKFEELVFTLYEIFLTLQSRGSGEIWEVGLFLRELIKTSPELCLQNPKLFLNSSINAFLNLYKDKDFDLFRWRDFWKGINVFRKEPVGIVLKMIFVFTWICGKPQYRDLALEYSEELPSPMFDYTFGVSIKESDRKAFLNRVRMNPFNTFQELKNSVPPPTRLVFRITGGFYGFGGSFLTTLSIDEKERTLVYDDESFYRFHSDFTGTYTQKVLSLDSEETNQILEFPANPGKDTITIEGITENFPSFPRENLKKVYGLRSVYFITPASFNVLMIGIA
ncbi:MAG: hypothetical protein H7A24_08470 [Leptospiraceae bacterium]|nr:hypothetical protein [Leptospiraceae bacterium]MCP5511901.1 hypothetical protein [Leptospiraceae bacterium]